MVTLLITVVKLPSTAFAGEEKPSVSETGETGEEKPSVSEAGETGEETTDLQTQGQEKSDEQAGLEKLLAQVKEILPIILGMNGDDPLSNKERIAVQVKRFVKKPGQVLGDFWDSVFGTGADGISKENVPEKKGKVNFVMSLPDPVKMPDTYSVSYHRLDKKKKEVITLLERDSDGNIHFVDGKTEQVFVKTDEGFRMYPVRAGQTGFGRWNGVVLSARSVREKTAPFWDCADQTFIKWLGVDLTEKTEYLGRPCGLYHAQPGTITFTYQCDMVIDDETGICLCYTADKLLKGATYNITEDHTIEIGIGDYRIGSDGMKFYCTEFKTEDVSFDLPEL